MSSAGWQMASVWAELKRRNVVKVAVAFAVAAKLCVLTVLVAASASAHHSHTRFDLDRVVAFQGTVVEFEWKNPHVYLTVADEAGAEWIIETDPTPVMSRSGWTSDSFSPGDAVAVRANPDRRPDVTHGLLLSIEGPDGISMASWNTTTQDTHDGPVARATTLEGVWQGERSSLKNFVVHMSAQPLTEKGEAAKSAYNDLLNPTVECISWPTPFILSSYLYLSELELGDEIVTFRNEFYGTERTIYMDGRPHPADFERTLQGHSVGHWAGDTLVVDTVGFADHRSPYGSGTGIPSGAEKHVIERYRLSEDGTQAFVDIVLEDPEYISVPVTATFAWRYSPHFEMLELGCDREIAIRSTQ